MLPSSFSDKALVTLSAMNVCTAGVCTASDIANTNAVIATIVTQSIFNARLMMMLFLYVQLAKIIKISDKIRIFADGYAKHIVCPFP